MGERIMKVVIVGAGITGLTVARRLFSNNVAVEVFETREHIGGNCHDEVMDGVLVHRYGGHVFHTSDLKVYGFISHYADFKAYPVHVVARTQEGIIPIPFGRKSAELIGDKTPEQIRDLVFRHYSEKQWGMSWEDLPEEIMRRVPVKRNSDMLAYHDDTVSAIPKAGYAGMFNAIAEGMTVHTGCARNEWKKTKADVIVYTGMIDEYFDSCFGNLEYRSLTWEYRREPKRYYPIMNDCTTENPYTRSVDHAHWLNQYVDKSVIGYEFPCAHTSENEPMYPVPTAKNKAIYRLYLCLAEREPNTFFAGRLGTYKYLDMDKAVSQGLAVAEKILDRSV